MTITSWHDGPTGPETGTDAADVVSLDGIGVELDVRSRPLARLAASPVASRTGRVARAAARHSATAAKVTVGTAVRSVARPAPWVTARAGRFVSGQLMLGEERTDATFWRDGRKQLHAVGGETSGWAFRARWKRAVTRVGLLMIGWAIASLVSMPITVAATQIAGSVVAVWGAWAAVSWYRTREHRRNVLIPLHRALSRVLPDMAATRPEGWLHVPVGYLRDPEAEIKIDLPVEMTSKDEAAKQLQAVVKEKLGLDSETRPAWQVAGATPHVIFRQPSRPPRKVILADIMPLLEARKATAPIIGLGPNRVSVDVDVESESPHILLSTPTGGGKSVLMRSVLAQGLAKGGYGIILDVKQMSHMWADKLANCEYHRSDESIHNRLIALQREIERRNTVAMQHANLDGEVVDAVNIGPRHWILVEELNTTISRLRKYWEEVREKGDPKTSPAVDAFLELLFMGRQIEMHIITAAQMATARSTGGPEGRENFGTRCLARYSMNAWKMLCPEVMPMPKKSSINGRWQIVKNGTATETQVVYMTAAEARQLAQAGYVDRERSGEPTPAAAAATASYERVVLGQAGETVSGETCADQATAGRPEGGPVTAASVLVSLREAVDNDLVSGMKLTTLRKWPQRDPHHFPEVRGMRGVEKLYDASELGVWARNRRSTLSAIKEDDDGVA